MQSGPIGITAAAFFSVVGFVEGVEVIAPQDRPLVTIESVALDGSDVIYSRHVNTRDPIRAAWQGDIVDIETELSVRECEAEGRATYGPEEPETQVFPADLFFGPGCLDALIPGATYEIWASVTPLDGPPSQIKGEPFTWQEEGK